MRLFLLLLLFLFQNETFGQSQKQLDFKVQANESYAFSLDTSDIYAFTAIAVRFEKKEAPKQIFIRSKSIKNAWSDWKNIPRNAHGNSEYQSFGQIFITAPQTFFEVKTNEIKPFQGTIHLYSPIEFRDNPSPQTNKSYETIKPVSFEKNATCTCPQPAYIDRAAWGGPPNQQAGCMPNYTTVSHMVVHHEAATPVPPYAAAVKSIWQFHTSNQGWCDIAYNWLIAPDGVLYEGRAGGDNVLGAHFCGDNGGTMGVCLLGNFEVEEPTNEALTTLEKLLAWKTCIEGVNPDSISLHAASGKQLPHITGHRLGCATLCPGESLFNKLPDVQNQVALLYNDPTGCDGIYPPINDQCLEATPLQSETNCTFIAADVEGATPSGILIPTCTGFTSPTAMDVWFKFTAESSTETITVQPNSMNLAGIDPVLALYEGSCDSLNLVGCSDTPGGAGGNGNLIVTDLNIGQEYWIRVFDFGSTAPSDPNFDICIRHQTVSSNEQPQLDRIQLFPNPTSHNFTIKSEESIETIWVYDALGRLIFLEKYNVKGDVNIQCSAWTNGLYKVQVLSSTHKLETFTFLKQ